MARDFTAGDYLEVTIGTGIDLSGSYSLILALRLDGGFRGILRLGPGSSRGVQLESGLGGEPRALGFKHFGNSTQTAGDGVNLTQNQFYAIGCLYDGTQYNRLVYDGTGVNGNFGDGDPSPLEAGDTLKIGGIGGGGGDFDGGVAWVAFIQGTMLTDAQVVNYVKQENGKTICSLQADFGANLKFLYSLSGPNRYVDLTGNFGNLTASGTTDEANPFGLPDACGSPSLVNIDFARHPNHKLARRLAV